MASTNPPAIGDLLQDHGERYLDARSAMARAVLRWERPLYERHLLWRLPEQEATECARRLFQMAWEDEKRTRWGEIPEEYLTELVERHLPDWIQASRLGDAPGIDEELAAAPKLLTDVALATLTEERAALLRDCLARTDETKGKRGKLTDEQFRMLREAADSALTEIARHFPLPGKAEPAGEDAAGSPTVDQVEEQVPDSEQVEATNVASSTEVTAEAVEEPTEELLFCEPDSIEEPETSDAASDEVA